MTHDDNGFQSLDRQVSREKLPRPLAVAYGYIVVATALTWLVVSVLLIVWLLGKV